MRRLRALALFGVSALALPGCWIYENDPVDESPAPDARAPAGGSDQTGGAGGGSTEDAGTGGATPPTCVERRAAYPSGPFDTDEDDVIANLAFTDGDGTAVDLQALRADCTWNLAVITTSAGWCTSCREEQPKLQALYDDYKARGLLVVVTLFEDDNYAPATPHLVAGWKERYELTLPVLADIEFVLGDYYDRDQTPMTMVLDLETMQIRRIMTGFIDADVRSIVDTLL